MRLGAWTGLATPAIGMGLLSLCVSATDARAGVYKVVRSTPDEITLMDPEAVEGVPKTAFLQAWSVTVRRNLVTGGPPQPGYVRTLNEYDCAQGKVRWRSFSAYSRFGALVMSKSNDTRAWNPVPHGDDNEGALRTVCGEADVGGVISAASLGQLVISLMQAWDPQAPLVVPPAHTGKRAQDKRAGRR